MNGRSGRESCLRVGSMDSRCLDNGSGKSGRSSLLQKSLKALARSAAERGLWLVGPWRLPERQAINATHTSTQLNHRTKANKSCLAARYSGAKAVPAMALALAGPAARVPC